nr:D-amino-acid oxidase-like [Leptinotarsa decemlineata]
MVHIAIVGCGVIGITSGMAIQNRIKGAKVTIFTEKVSPNTTTDLAGGLWEPYLVGDTPPKKVAKWGRITYDYLLDLWKSGKAGEAGISLQPVTTATDEEGFQRPDWLEYTLGYSELSEEKLAALSKRYKTKLTWGVTFTNFLWEGMTMLPFLQKEFIENKGDIIMKKISNLEELSGYDVVLNCTGLGSQELIDDPDIKPIRGQIMKVNAPWVFHSYLMVTEKCGYVLSNKSFTTLGGTRQVDDYNTNVNEDDKEYIWRNCSELLPSIKSAEVIEHQVGLRPARNKVRLEAEIKRTPTCDLKIVHNYGHGGAGITLSVGCAAEAAELVEKLLKGNSEVSD